MNPASPGNGLPGAPAAPPRPKTSALSFAWRVVATALLLGTYYWGRAALTGRIGDWLGKLPGGPLDASVPRVVAVIVLLAALLAVWHKLVWGDKRFQAPLLITCILAIGDAAFSILENHPAPPWIVSATGGAILEYSPTFVAIVAVRQVQPYRDQPLEIRFLFDIGQLTITRKQPDRLATPGSAGRAREQCRLR